MMTKNLKACAMELVRIGKALTAVAGWDEVLQLIETKKQFGNEEFVDFCAEVLNGGLQQWIENGKSDDLQVVVRLAQRLGPKGDQLARILTNMRDEIREYAKLATRSFRDEQDSEDNYDLLGQFDDLDDWFYANDDAVIAEFLAYLKQ